MTTEMVVNNNIQLRDIQSIIENGEQIVLDGDTMCRVDDCFRFLDSFAKDKVIYAADAKSLRKLTSR